MCIFCQKKHQVIAEDDYVYAIYDAYPVSQGHTLIIPKKHRENTFDLTKTEWASLFKVLQTIKNHLDETFHPDGYNIGMNNGIAAGQTVMHMHMHIIPRYHKDVGDPRGGVRGVIPEKQKY